jgi:hypothetical protein
VGLLPFVSIPEIDPEIILVGILPPLLHSAAVALPAIESEEGTAWEWRWTRPLDEDPSTGTFGRQA